MKIRQFFLFYISVIMLFINCRKSEEAVLTFTVSNPSPWDRESELVALPFDDSISIAENYYRVIEKTSGNEMVSQLLDLEGDASWEELLVQVQLPANGSKSYALYQTENQANAYPSQTYGRFVPERKDDFAWENDCIAHRMYGPALQDDGEISSGVDVWVKSVDYLILDKWYQPGVDYHTDQGEGLDYYKVGPSRGCGGIGIWDGRQLHLSDNFTGWKILANGPLRTVFELQYSSWIANDVVISEVKRITLDAGQQLSRFESRMTFSQTINGLLMAVGIAKRGSEGELRVNKEKGWLRYWEPEDEINGTIGCAVVVDPGVWVGVTEDDLNHLLLVKLPSVYYAGACWNKHKNFPDVKAWDAYLDQFVMIRNTPLNVEIDKNP
jgi:hypothetical protein